MPRAPSKFTDQTTENYYAKTSCKVSNDFEFSNVSEEDVKKILLSLGTSKAAGIDQIPAAFLRDGAEAPLLAIIGSSFGKYKKFINKIINFPRGV